MPPLVFERLREKQGRGPLDRRFPGTSSRGGTLSLEGFLRAIPKVELHVHLEGAMRPRTLLALARRRRVTLPADDEAGLREWFRFRDFDHFVEIYLTCSKCVRDPEDFQRLLADFAARPGGGEHPLLGGPFHHRDALAERRARSTRCSTR